MAATDVIHERAINDLASLVQGLALTGTPGVVPDVQQVVSEMTFDESNLLYPCVLLSCDDEEEEEDPETTSFEQDGVIYPVRILILDRVSERFAQARPVYLKWRRAILRLLRSLVTTILPNTPECWKVSTRALKIFDPRLPHYQFMVSGLVARCHTVEPRLAQVS